MFGSPYLQADFPNGSPHNNPIYILTVCKIVVKSVDNLPCIH